MDVNLTKGLSQLGSFFRKWGIHLLFIAVFVWLFPRSSGLRPVICNPPYLELLAAFWVLLFLYSHYLFWIPKVLCAKRIVLYIIVAVVTVLICSGGEMLLLRDDLCRVAYGGFNVRDRRYFLLQDLYYVSLRDIGLMTLFLILRMWKYQHDKVTDLQKNKIHKPHVIQVKDHDNNILLLETDDILYCHQDKNYTYYHTAKDTYTSLTSLRKVKELFGDDCVQISRNTLVMRHAIAERKNAYVKLCDKNDPEYSQRLIINESFQE